ncbi:hypothetical protein NEOC84_001511|uniref:hypothetical protein n=1 Tax=Neochlamydia sp. AcF84 TaxID=2315858 RepID=UPI00140BCC0E|nr:hypothetical protein [Neochlamydia sp. AcF84]NGY95590.1 hypothetical protein [Neochlamydia sp. AcF84]
MDNSSQSPFVRANLDTLSLEGWNILVGQMLDSQQEAVKKEGRKYIYLNPHENEIAVGRKKEIPSGFTKLTHEKIIEISISKLPPYLSEDQVIETQKSINRIFSTKEPQTLSKKFFSIFSSSSSSVGSKVPIEIAINHRAVLGELERTLPETVQILRSIAGQTGIYFLHHTDYSEAPLALKLMPNPSTHVIADHFYRKLNFSTPLYTTFPRESELGQLALKKLENLALNDLREKHQLAEDSQQAEIYGERIRQLEYQLESTQHIMVMKYISGTPFAELPVDEFMKALTQEKILLDIGEMIFLDVLFHNTDRMHPERSNNLDNLLLQTEPSEGKRSIALIDHDFKVDSRNWTTVAKTLENLAKGNLTEKIIDNLCTSINFKLKDDPVTAEEYQESLKKDDKIRVFLQEGFRKGAHNLLEACKDSEVLPALLDVSSPNNPSSQEAVLSDRVETFKKLLKIVKKEFH